jgi:hypothetical protein
MKQPRRKDSSDNDDEYRNVEPEMEKKKVEPVIDKFEDFK